MNKYDVVHDGYKQFKNSKCIMRLFDSDFNPLGHFAKASSVIFNRRLQGGGDFRIHIPFEEIKGDKGKTSGARHLLKEDTIVIINDDIRLSGYVFDFEIDVDVYDEGVVVYGKTGQGIANNQIVVPPKKDEGPEMLGWDRVKGKSETVLKHYARMHMEQPYNKTRTIKNLKILEDLQRGDDLVWQCRFTPLNEELTEISRFASIGYEVLANSKDKRWELDTIHGLDRSKDNDINKEVILSMFLSNINGYRYEEDKQNYRNVGYAGGQGEDEDRLIYVLNPEIEGIARREVFLDCGNAEHIDELIYYGEQKLNQYQKNISVDISALPKVFVIDEDYFLGDTVTVAIDEIGLRRDVQLTEIEDTWQGQDKHRQRAVFGELTNPLDILKTKGEIR